MNLSSILIQKTVYIYEKFKYRYVGSLVEVTLRSAEQVLFISGGKLAVYVKRKYQKTRKIAN